MDISWEKDAKEKFRKLLDKVPVFLRSKAQEKVTKKAEGIAALEGRSRVIEKDLVDALFSETPFGFHGPMKTDMEALGIDYTKYGHAR